MTGIVAGIATGITVAAAWLLAGPGWRALENWSIQRRRLIFRFWDGRRVRAVDPLLALRLLRSDPEYDDRVHLPLIDAGDDDAIRITAAATRRALGIDDVAGNGLSDLECLAVLTQFLNFLQHVKKNIVRLPNSPESTARKSSTGSITKPESACSSTSTESRPDTPGAS